VILCIISRFRSCCLNRGNCLFIHKIKLKSKQKSLICSTDTSTFIDTKDSQNEIKIIVNIIKKRKKMRVVNSNRDTTIIVRLGNKPNSRSFITKGVPKDIKEIFLFIRNSLCVNSMARLYRLFTREVLLNFYFAATNNTNGSNY
jgi:hypothetical protein